MNKIAKLSASLLGAAALAAVFGCSDSSGTSVDDNIQSGVQKPSEFDGALTDDAEVALPGTAPVQVNAKLARSRLSLYTRDVEHAWAIDSTKGDTLSVAVDESFIENSFAVEADVVVESSTGYITLASAGVDGNQDAWALRVENGKPFFAWRDASTAGDWYKLETDEALKLNELVTVRAERVDSLTVLYIDGQIVAAVISSSEIKSLEGSFTIGFDPTAVTENTPGRVMFVRFEKVREVKIVEPSGEEEVLPPLAQDTLAASGDDSEAAGDSALATQVRWIADWEFNDSANVGRDYTGNNHTALAGLGSVETDGEVAHFDGKSGLTVELANDLKINSFVIEARVKPTKFATMQNIIVAEPPGQGVDGWMLRVDEGTLRVHMRDDALDGDDWQIFAGKDLTLNEWNEIRFERVGDSLKLFQDGELTVAAAYKGDVTQMRYDWGIGFDAMQQNYNTRYFEGDMDYVRFGTLDKLSGGSVAETSPYVLLADWEFNDPAFPGLDKMGNNSYKGLVASDIKDGAFALKGDNGMPVYLTSTFKRNEFVVDARVKPTAYGTIQNVIVAEPPGRFGDGWMVRVDDGVLRVHLRDEVTHGTEWQVFAGEPLDLNQWTEIRVIRSAGKIQVYQNGKLTVDENCSGDVGQLGYGLGIGYDAMNQAFHDRYFVGSIDYIRYYGIRK